MGNEQPAKYVKKGPDLSFIYLYTIHTPDNISILRFIPQFPKGCLSLAYVKEISFEKGILKAFVS